MAGLNISDKVAPIKSTFNFTLRLVLFFHFRYCFAGSLQFSSSTNKRNYSTPISEMFFTFCTRKTL